MAKISSITFHYVLRALEANCELTISQMLAFANLDKKDLVQEDGFIPSYKLSQIFLYCMEKSNDYTLALKIGTSISYHSLGILGYLMTNAKTLRQLIEKFDKYQNLISGFLKFNLEKSTQHYKLSIYINENPMIPVPSFHSEVHLSAIVTILSQILNKELTPFLTHFSFERKSSLLKYNETFGENIFFNKDENSIYFDNEKLETPISSSNPVMLKYFEEQANSILLNRQESSFYAKVKKEILKNLGEHDITIDFIADIFSMSPRSLQYQLKSENKKFREALLEVRMQLANHLIGNSKMDLSTISLYLGYSEPSSFFRAYKRFYKKTPSQS